MGVYTEYVTLAAIKSGSSPSQYELLGIMSSTSGTFSHILYENGSVFMGQVYIDVYYSTSNDDLPEIHDTVHSGVVNYTGSALTWNYTGRYKYLVNVYLDSSKEKLLTSAYTTANDVANVIHYSINSNQSEILRFAGADNFTISPTSVQVIFSEDATPVDPEDNAIINLYLPSHSSSLEASYTNIFANANLATYWTYENGHYSLAINDLIEADSTNWDSNAQAIQQALATTDCVLDIQWLDSNAVLARSLITVRYAVSQDMATFGLYASGINAAVQNSSLVFDANGLTINNGAINIKNNNGESILESDLNGNLVLRGTIYASGGEFTGTIHATDGEFTGVIYAQSGEFNGTINAAGGTIGGFEIGENYIKSSNGKIELNSTTGKVIADEIQLGDGTSILNEISLGDLKLQNPASHPYPYRDDEGIVLQTNDFMLTDHGCIRAGSFIIDPVTDTIQGNHFRISAGDAVFNNVSVTGKISTAIFEQNHVQSVGGAMIFRPSFKVISTALTEVEIDGKYSFNAGDRCYLVTDSNDTFIVTVANDVENGDVIQFDDEGGTLSLPNNVVSLTYFGNDNDILIGINSNDTIYPWLYGRGLTITTYNATTPKLFLGDLNNLNIANISGYGLYSENVYLNGSLTTRYNALGALYAGVNTIGNINFNQQLPAGLVSDNSPIVFWAGSNGTANGAIQNAPFQVTSNGTLYAQQAYIKGSIITDATISGADIYAVRLHGGTENANNALTIYDTAYGILFKSGYRSDNEATLFRIAANGFYSGDSKQFIGISDEGVITYSGDTAALRLLDLSDTVNKVKFDAKSISFYQTGDGETLQYSINNEDSFKIKKYIDGNAATLINCNGDVNEFNGTVNHFSQDINFGDKLNFKRVSEGYDLYVED